MASLRNLAIRLPYCLNRKFILAILDRELRKACAEYSPASTRLLYITASCLPCHISGYTSRTHELLRALANVNSGFEIITRPGYPWDRKDSLHLPLEDATILNGLKYNHLRHPTRLKHIVHYVIAASRKIEKYAREHSIGRIHAASNHLNALPGLIAARKLGIPFQYEMRGLWELTRASRVPGYAGSPAYSLGLELEGFVAKHASRIYAISRQLSLYAAKLWDIPENKFEILPNCVDATHVTPGPQTSIIPGLLGYAGSLISYEGLDTLLEAMKILINKGIPANLRIIGDGEAKNDLVSLRDKLGLQNNVHFAGRLSPEDARKKLADCAIVCIPRKPFEVCRIVTPIKLVEAMAMGKPVIVPDLAVFRDEVGSGMDELFFKAGDCQDLAAILESALANPHVYKNLGDKLRQKVIATRQWKQHVDKLFSHLEN